ncbi:MAG TPA: hypothetical protein VN914_21975 [Polyangia bacterium]|nr:hypothetical protein [Polyangia bacterium]
MKVIIAILLLSASAARAEDKPAAEALMPWEKACDPDIKKLCKDVKDDVRPCLADHEKELSKDCTKHFSAAGYRVAKLCEGDFAKFCADAAAKGTLGKCVQANADKFTAKCRNALVAGSEKQTKAEEKAKEKAAAKKEKAAAKKEK